MHLHHLAASALVAIVPSLSRVNAGGGRIARLSAVEPTPRPGRLLRSTSSASRAADDDGSHHGQVQLALLGGAAELIEADSIELSIPSPGEESKGHELYEYHLDWRDEAGMGWHGRLRDGSGTAHFVASPLEGLQENRLAGFVHRGDGTTLRVTTKPDGTHWFESWDDDESSSAARTSHLENEDGENSDEEAREDDGRSGRSLQEQPAFGDDDGSVIDHLSVYTRRGMCEHALVGYYPCPDTPYVRAPIEEFIALQVTVTNYVLANTHIATRLRSVHVFMDPYYDQDTMALPPPTPPGEDPKAMIGVALGHLKNVDSGHLEEARRRQNSYCADVVTLFVTDGLGLASGQYSALNHGSNGWGFAHEIGHNINAGHRNDNTDKVGYGYGYGYGPDDSDPSYYATIMAFGGKKVPMYSTPDYDWQGKAVGTPTENNRQSIIDQLLKTTNKRRSEMCDPACEYGSDGTPMGCPSTCSKCHFPPDFCYDDPFFRYAGETDQNCEWVRKNPAAWCKKNVSVEDRRDIDVKDHCPVSCGACPAPTPMPTGVPTEETCEDDPTFLKSGNEGRGCDWVADSVDTRCGDNAGDVYPDGAKIYDYCRRTCNLCHVDATPPPTPTPCADIPGNHFQQDTEGCDWIAEKIDPRCTKYSKAATHCPETCGLCDVPTSSPTRRGPCADDVDWKYMTDGDKYSQFLTCAWVAEDAADRCNHSRMKHHCPVTCGTCCEDEEGWHKGINQSGGGDPQKNCAYYGANGCGNAAMEHCTRTCGLCPNYLANAGGPRPDAEYSSRARHLRSGGKNI